MHTNISANQLFRVCTIYGFPVGQLVGSCGLLIFFQMALEGNREAAVMTAGGELWVPEKFP